MKRSQNLHQLSLAITSPSSNAVLRKKSTLGAAFGVPGVLGAGAISPSADVKVPIAVRITVSETSCAGGAGGATGFTGAGAMGGGILFPSPSLAGIPVASVPDMFTKNRKRTRIAKANLEIQAPTRHQIRTFL